MRATSEIPPPLEDGPALLPRTQGAWLSFLGLGCAIALLLFIFRPVLFEGRQFAFRDSAYYYYPLYQRVQQEWQAGRIPLWDQGQNAGMPLLGNPTAAVLYPGKIVYAVLPYPWAARTYIITHVLIAYLGLVALARTLNLSWTAANLAGLSYSFGAPVLFQYCNVIFLVGSAWIPWGLRAIDRLLRQGQRRGGVELPLVLAFQVLGSDPEAAYLTGICGVLYAFMLALRGRLDLARYVTRTRAIAVSLAWTVLVLGLAWLHPAWAFLPGHRSVSVTLWLLPGAGLLWWRMRRGDPSGLTGKLAQLATCGILAALLAAAQLVPTLELVGKSRRAAGVNDYVIHQFSVDPLRCLGLLWPSVLGTPAPVNRCWATAFWPEGDHAPWHVSLYLGAMVPLLALCAGGWKDGPPWRSWLTTVGLLASLASLGKYAGPLWWARCGPLASAIGAHDPLLGRLPDDPFFNDGAGSCYGLLLWLLPGFDAFRYPAKLFPFFAAALTVLAGAGWDRVAAGTTAGLRRLAKGMLVLSLCALGLALLLEGRAVAWLGNRVTPEIPFGPADIAAGWRQTQEALCHGAIVTGLVWLIVRRRWTRCGCRDALVLVVLTVDLGLAGSRLIWTVPQSVLDAPSTAAGLIAAAQREHPAPGPFRIQRLSEWYPLGYQGSRSDARLDQAVAWERSTLRPEIALPMGLEYCEVMINVELDDYFAFFQGSEDMPAPAALAQRLGIAPDQPLFYYPRRGYDLWGARYFLLPAYPSWRTADRGFASFLANTELLYPDRDALLEKANSTSSSPWSMRQDWQLRRNLSAYPRAWVVHRARVRPADSSTEARDRLMDTLLFINDPIWQEPGRTVFDLRAAALIETDRVEPLRPYLAGKPAGDTESVTVTERNPQHVELKARLEAPGLVILADTFYPGWTLEIDGRPATIYRANRMMRGAAVPAGAHTLVYRYQPASFRIGLVLSTGGLLVLLLMLSPFRLHI